ncbi:putative integral membrane protein [Babesia bovis T2Bo]|uniref:Uncharacterized protein n=1 Tax=Babesia bovis TaxID=5865 RepID=A7ASQ0_BABBO|nr:putative integral membrane protein [Babesia bovis T2Bo]EDO07569.1 putative integral membrane protein [Babesia bovis T2Bo]|eukprot:XP_001611137.1 hypothetical protein [Babesia bovis T2Bo]
MLVYPVLVLALGALWPLDWTPTRLDSLSPVTGHYHDTTWAMAEKVTQGDDPGEEVVVVEGTTSDEVAKNKESPKGWFSSWGTDGILLVVLLVALGSAFLGVVASGLVIGNKADIWWTAGALLLLIVVIIVYNRKMLMKKIFCTGSSGNSLRKMTPKNLD